MINRIYYLIGTINEYMGSGFDDDKTKEQQNKGRMKQITGIYSISIVIIKDMSAYSCFYS